MSNSSIIIENVGKKYVLGKAKQGDLRELISARIKSFYSKSEENSEEFWALKNISATIEKGDRVGIVGRNGAGKSTLLKILSKITAPTTGHIEINGRLASLLEVGTGFHPELTGRENIYLNGTILGMQRKEIKEQFDEIVAFSGIEKFIDTPVKRYSSGMYVRLAFAVAAHLNSEILIIDEVLAVGDIVFQKKCLGKMEEVASMGRTVLFVSHNLGAVQNLCNTSMLLQQGELTNIGATEDILPIYLNSLDGSSGMPFIDLTNYDLRKGNQCISFTRAEIKNSKGELCNQFSLGESVIFNLYLDTKQEIRDFKIAISIHNSAGILLGHYLNSDSHFEPEVINGEIAYEVCFEDLRFYPDTYYVSFWIGGKESVDDFDYLESCMQFDIINGGKLTPRKLKKNSGLIFLMPSWSNL